MKNFIFRALKGTSGGFPPETDEPIRAELFSVERLEQHAESLAEAQPITTRPGSGRQLAKRLRDNGRVLLEAYSSTIKAIREERAITQAAEWLIDNFYVAQEQIREIRDDLPRGFYRGLPKLAEGPFQGYPRVFGVAWAFVAHTDSRFEPQMLCRFVQAYQRVQPLSIGELWAVAITLRIVLVENLRRSAARLVRDRAMRQEADALADRLLGAGGREAEAPEIALRGFNQAPLPTAFAVQLVQRLRDQDPKVTPALTWLDERLASMGTTADEAVRTEHQKQGAMNVTVRNVITSMRLISAVDWTEFFESVSLVDAALRADSDFAAMDFATRDRYRHAIEELARGSGQPELEVARHAIAAAKRAAAEPHARLRICTFQAGARLLPDFKRAADDRKGDRIPCSDERMAGPGQRGRGHPRLCRSDRHHRRAHRGSAIAWRGGVRRQRMDSLRARASRPGAGIGCGGGTGQPRRCECLRSQDPAGYGASRRSAREPAHDGRRADALDDPS